MCIENVSLFGIIIGLAALCPFLFVLLLLTIARNWTLEKKFNDLQYGLLKAAIAGKRIVAKLEGTSFVLYEEETDGKNRPPP